MLWPEIVKTVYKTWVQNFFGNEPESLKGASGNSRIVCIISVTKVAYGRDAFEGNWL